MHTLNDISCMKQDLIEGLRYEMRCKGYNNMDIDETGQVVDMIKDLASAEKDCMEKCYYESVVMAMHEHDFENEHEIEAEGRYGYDNRRYSSGRYAPKGEGHYSPVHGYTPTHHMGGRMGYPMSQTGTTRRVTSGSMGYIPNDMMDVTGDYGRRPIDEYRESRKHYTETKDPNEKMKMDHFAKSHADETIESIKEIWYDANPEMKKDLKSKFNKLLAEMQL